MVGLRIRFQSHFFICELVTIVAVGFIARAATFMVYTFASDEAARGDRANRTMAFTPDRVSTGAKATILAVMVCHDVLISAGSL